VRSATLVLLPYDSRDQVTSGVLVEALAAGRPVVATAFPHAVELAATGAVRVVPHGADDELAGAIHAVLCDPGAHARMSAAARTQSHVYDWARVAARVDALIARVTASHELPAVTVR
jgi:glycosyltransferase involved in cell wall biosynthesis